MKIFLSAILNLIADPAMLIDGNNDLIFVPSRQDANSPF